jgi:hypothetical protein
MSNGAIIRRFIREPKLAEVSEDFQRLPQCGANAGQKVAIG